MLLRVLKGRGVEEWIKVKREYKEIQEKMNRNTLNKVKLSRKWKYKKQYKCKYALEIICLKR